MKKKKFVGALILAILLLVVLIVKFPLETITETEGEKESISNKEISSAQIESNVEQEINLGSNVYVTGVDTYIGAYVEDGSDEFVENIMMLTLENKGEEYIQFATVTLNNNYIFEITTLFPGEKVLVLEKNRAEYQADFGIESAEISNVALFAECPSMNEDVLKITGEDGMITITNVSGEKFAGGKVFYKNVLDDGYLGGITYAGTIPELEADEMVKLSAKHFVNDSSEFVFVTYAK